MVFSLFEYLDSVNCNHRYYAQLWQLFDKKRYNSDQKEIERKKRSLVGMKFCCLSNAAIKNVIFQKIQILRNDKVYFQILEVLPVILITYLSVWL